MGWVRRQLRRRRGGHRVVPLRGRWRRVEGRVRAEEGRVWLGVVKKETRAVAERLLRLRVLHGRREGRRQVGRPERRSGGRGHHGRGVVELQDGRIHEDATVLAAGNDPAEERAVGAGGRRGGGVVPVVAGGEAHVVERRELVRPLLLNPRGVLPAAAARPCLLRRRGDVLGVAAGEGSHFGRRQRGSRRYGRARAWAVPEVQHRRRLPEGAAAAYLPAAGENPLLLLLQQQQLYPRVALSRKGHSSHLTKQQHFIPPIQLLLPPRAVRLLVLGALGSSLGGH